MKRITAFAVAAVMALSVTSCGTLSSTAEVSSSASATQEYLCHRFGTVPSDVVLGDATVAAEYGVDMSDFEDGGYIVRSAGDKTLVLGKAEEGLDSAVRYYANHVHGKDIPADAVFGEGERVDSFTICGRDISEYVITVTEAHPEGSYPESTAYAARELAYFIGEAVGVTVPVVAEADLAEGQPHFRFTCDGTGANGEEGFTVTVTPEGNVEILGGLKRGCLFAAYDICERWLGIRFVSWDYTHIYEAERVEVTEEDSYSDAPGMVLRYPYNYSIHPGVVGFAARADFAARNKLNGNTTAPVYGYTPVVTANHGLYKYWNTGSAADNPCMNDEELVLEIIDNVEYELEGAKKSGALYSGNYYHVNLGQNDNNVFCRCEKCLEVFTEEGRTHAGSLVRLVKLIADTFAQDYPEARFGILAYWGTEKAPAITKLPDNAFVTYCITGSCYCGPMDGSECRAERFGLSGFTVEEERENLLGWNEVTDHLKLWYYYFSDNISTPTNVIRNMYTDFSYLYSLGVREMFVEFEHTMFDYGYPANWLLSKLMWDPTMTEEEFNALRDEIMQITYGDGYRYLYENMEVYDSELLCSDRWFWGADISMNIVGAKSEYQLYLLEKAEELCDSARTERNLKLIKVHVLYNALCAWYQPMQAEGTEEDRAYYDSLMTELLGILDSSGATYISFWKTGKGTLTIPEIEGDSDPNTWIQK